MKTCQKCKILKDFVYFSKDKSQEDKFSRRCKDCVKEYKLQNLEHTRELARNFYYKNKNKYREKFKESYNDKKEHYSSARKIYYHKNKDKILQKNKKWYHNNKDRVKELNKKHKQENKHLARHNKVKRRVIEKQALPKWANLTKIKEIYKNCPKGMVVDHIIPLNSNFVCGFHVETNLQYLTPKENSIKSNKVDHLRYLNGN